MGCISEEGIPYNKGYISEMNIALAAMDARLPLGRALEIGAGNGRLIPYFLRRGNAYEALELSDWACRYVTECFDVPAHCTPFCDYDCEPETYDLILAFHSLEHMADAEQAFEKIASLLKPGGMFLYGGPAGTDLVNPDHVWFWEEPALRFWLESVGLHVQAVHHTTIQPHEDTLYAIAVR
jgi:SAM-dependent methyltransferase